MKRITKIILPVFLVFVQFFAKDTFAAVQTYIEADHSELQYMGRINFANPKAPEYTFPGVSIKMKFTGTGISVVLKDYASGGTTTTNYYNVYIDDVITKVIQCTSADTLYPITSSLGAGSHIVEITKRTESSVGKSSFKGFVITDGAVEALPLKSTYKMEFIGDSWTCGYGNEISTTSPNTGFNSANEDNDRAWGRILARRFNAQYHCTAYSGRGVYRNNTGSTSNTLNTIFPQLYPDQSTTWDFNNYIPDMVFTHLGTNDFFPETLGTPSMLDSASYVNAYINLVTSIRTNYPNAHIIIAFGNSKSDWWPSGLKHLTRWRNYTQAIKKHFTDLSDTKVYSFEFSVQNSPYGEDWHPTITTHNGMAQEITSFVQNINGITPSSYTAPTQKYVFTSNFDALDEDGSGSVFPNPFKEYIKIQSDLPTDWVLYNLTGMALQSGNSEHIDTTFLFPGTYILQAGNRKHILVKTE